MQSNKEQYINSVNLNANTEFPYLVLDVINDTAYPRNLGFQVMHWHEDLQFIYVIDGMIEIQTLDNIIQVSTGEAFFINKNVVHYVKKLGSCHYNSFLFPAYFLEFYPGSPTKALVDTVTTNAQLNFLHFVPTVQWHRMVISLLFELSELEQNKSEFYPYEVLVRLTSVWLIIRKNIALPTKKGESITNIRIQKILQYIDKYYAEDISLFDLAQSANISKSECFRCFKSSLNTTPYKYLTEFRLSKAAQLLKQSNEPIGNIAANVGFHQISHFGKCFKEKTGYSPGKYREAINNSSF